MRTTAAGRQKGGALLHRHAVLESFFAAVNQTPKAQQLRLVEQIEHYIDPDTVDHLEALLKTLAPPSPDGEPTKDAPD